jgi:vacuolar-type H+-ATPase subunit F/Vma7
MNAVQVRVICSPEVAAGFALAGISVTEVHDAGEAQQVIARFSENEDTGVLLVQDDLLAGAQAEMEHSQRPLPMLVAFPGPARVKGRSSAEAFISEILRQAIGYRVRLK